MSQNCTARDIEDAKNGVFSAYLGCPEMNPKNADYFIKVIDIYAKNFRIHARQFIENNEFLGESAKELALYSHFMGLKEIEETCPNGVLAKYIANFSDSEWEMTQVSEPEKKLHNSVKNLFYTYANI